MQYHTDKYDLTCESLEKMVKVLKASGFIKVWTAVCMNT